MPAMAYPVRLCGKIIIAVAIATLSGVSAFAQMPQGPSINVLGNGRHMTPEERQRENQVESAYEAANKKIPDAKAPRDPWGAVRETPEPVHAKKR